VLKEFKEFIDKGDLVTIAVGLILALALTDLVNSLVDNIINPIIAAVFKEPNFDELTVEIGEGVITYGRFITALISFLILAFVLFLMVKGYNALTRKKEEEAGPTEVELLTEIRDSLKK
jgi:large conductance mechanosensitive channel